MHSSRPLILVVALVAAVEKSQVVVALSSPRSPSSLKPLHHTPTAAYFTLCNSATAHVCICEQQPANSPISRPHHPLCSRFIDTDQLPLIKLKLRRVNLTALLHTNETYESYLKRRIANIISKYCEQQANECPETTLRLQKENVVLLNVTTHRDDGATTIGFVITRQKNLRLLNRSLIFDAVKIKYILSAQVPSLSRVLGGVRIDRIFTDQQSRMETINDQTEISSTNENINLYIILGVIANFLLITYIIAAIKICREYFDRRKRERNAKSALKMSNNNQRTNYGSCKNDVNSPLSITSATKRSAGERHVSLAIEMDETTDASHPRMKFTNRMFQCDYSQLPAESSTLTEILAQHSRSTDTINKEEESGETINNNKSLVPQTDIPVDVQPETIPPIGGIQSKFVMLTEAHVVRSKTADVVNRYSSDSDDDHIDLYYQLTEVDENVNTLISKSNDSNIEIIDVIEPCNSQQNYHYTYEKLQESNSSSTHTSSRNSSLSSLNEDFSSQICTHFSRSSSPIKTLINHSTTSDE